MLIESLTDKGLQTGKLIRGALIIAGLVYNLIIVKKQLSDKREVRENV